jgi:hypothetical protein
VRLVKEAFPAASSACVRFVQDNPFVTGLWRLTLRCAAGGELSTAGLRIEAHGAEQDVVLVASVPLTTEGWVPLQRGEILVARCGQLHLSASA